ncbi:J domain-containing protein [uncultured Roseobacter sp.]|uniref:J domain-containing protein n=1 Tax=uncultured Roseobacter sp. TaxID=114847 RepID=UPI002621C063|nr:J domain-containing protein [uncultured Roseobacter sp.]
MNELLNAFEILGVAPGSDDETIRRAWRALVRTYHPDMAKADPKGANRRLAEINAAWDLVSARTDADVRRLKLMMAQRRLAEERRQRELELRRQQAQAAYQAAQKERLREEAQRKTAASGSETQSSASSVFETASSETNSKSAVNLPMQHGETTDTDARARSQLTAMARRMFEAARTICSAEIHEETRPVFM